MALGWACNISVKISSEEVLFELRRALLPPAQLQRLTALWLVQQLYSLLGVHLVVAQFLLRYQVEGLVLLLGLPYTWKHTFVRWLFVLLFQLNGGIAVVGSVVVGVKELLKLRLSQQQRVLLYKLCLLFVLYCYLLVLVKVALLHHGYKRRLYLLGPQLVPVEPT